jgi:enediyne biosynthesis protein E4
MRFYLMILFAIILASIVGCEQTVKRGDTLFQSLSSDTTHINFVNEVDGDAELNIFNYRNFYNGGGVAIGDVNNDGLSDVFLVSNMKENRLYLNKGGLRFEDITKKAGVGGTKAWSTGVTFADVNGDGYLDIYVCNAGNRENDDRSNELFINNGDLTFTESAERYGLADRGYSTHAAFFDYDRDGDLDMYLLNNSFIPVGKLSYKNLRSQRDKLGGHRFFRNDGDTFSDVSEDAGIYGSLISFGLGITVGDFNNDNWLDVYISNDFYERDYLYINNHDGTFTEDIERQMQHISLSSMGADAADVNNDGQLDLFVTDMLPGDDQRLKMLTNFEGYDLFQLKRSRDYHNQITQNTLQLNNGDNTFSEVARYCGVEATDWSWGALLFDMDNDGFKDIFVANGIYKDVTDQDFVDFLVDENTVSEMVTKKRFDFKTFQDKMSSTPIPNYAFRNLSDLKFSNKAKEWGLDQPSFSNGASYGDLDNDGDLDLIINNVNQPASVYRNTASDKSGNHWLRVKLKGYARNLHGIGTKVYAYNNGKMQYLQEMPNRGFESSVDHVLVFGFSEGVSSIDSLQVIWPDDRMQNIRNIKLDQEISLSHDLADQTWAKTERVAGKSFIDVSTSSGLDFKHQENAFVDYYQNPLLKQMYSTQGPAIAIGDVNGDGLSDVLFGSSKGSGMKLYVQKKTGDFVEQSGSSFAMDTLSENVDAVFFDADRDNDLDLFVVTGGNEFAYNDPVLRDKFYRNNGTGSFTLDDGLPNILASGSCASAADFDGDGDIDIFVGGRQIAGKFGYDPPSQLYVNDGEGEFKNFTRRYFATQEMGMVTDVQWANLDGDSYPELIVVGDWMPIMIFKNEAGKSFSRMNISALEKSDGWWNCIKSADLDGDGDLDFVLGNLGRNSRLRADSLRPAELYVKDFDNNGAVEQIITSYSQDNANYPIVLKRDLEKQLPFIKKRFIKHADYSGKQINEVFTEQELEGAIVKKVYNPNTSLLINDGGGRFRLRALPLESQFSPIFAVEVLDFDNDGVQDLLLCGNFHDVLPEIGAYDANYGLVLKGIGDLQYVPVMPKDSGFFITGQARRMRVINDGRGGTLVVVAKNNDRAQIFRVIHPEKLVARITP